MRPRWQQIIFLSLVAGPAELAPWLLAVARTRHAMNCVAGKAGLILFAPDNDVADVLQNVTIPWIQFRERGVGKIRRKVPEQIVSRHEVVWERQPTAARTTSPNVT